MLAALLCAEAKIDRGLADVLVTALSAGGASFPDAVYQDAGFNYKLTNGIDVAYTATGSSAGKCNMMGYWHTGNLNPEIPAANKTFDTNVCGDSCTVELCGFTTADVPRVSTDAKPNPYTLSRVPLLDFAGSDSILKASDYAAFPDLQLFPALAGAAVPVYNIHELTTQSKPLILSRATITQIYLGNIKMWNDAAILADNAANADIVAILTTLNKKIQIAVRQDGSGTTEIFSNSLKSFSPKTPAVSPDVSFETTVGGGERPMWCGQLTDEVQTMTIEGDCASNTTIVLQTIAPDFTPAAVTFKCSDDVATIKAAFVTAMKGKDLVVKIKSTSATVTVYTIGYLSSVDDSSKKPQNWFLPTIVSAPAGMKVAFKAVQEGGFKNTHYSSKPKSPEVQSIWVDGSVVGGSTFKLGYAGSATATKLLSTSDSTAFIATLKTELNQLSASFAVASVKRVTRTPSVWVEYQVAFTFADANPPQIEVRENPTSDGVTANTLMDMNGYPLFFDKVKPTGYSSSGYYTCYKREQAYEPFIYVTGNLNSGVVAAVSSIPYSLGYSVLDEANRANLRMASLINKAGVTVAPSVTSIAFAVMEQGGNLDSFFNALLVDGSGKNVWPMTGYTYLVLRTKKHKGDCARRQATAEYMFNFYYNPVVETIANSKGFSILQGFIRDLVVKKLVDSVMCNDGTFALQAKRTAKLSVYASSSVDSTIATYLNVYKSVDSSVSLSMVPSASSKDAYNSYVNTADTSIGVFAMFPNRDVKIATYNNTEILTAPFVNVPIATLYHLTAISTGTTKLRLTADILGGILSGDIKMWNDPKIIAANGELEALLPALKITVIVRETSDINGVLHAFLSRQSAAFKAKYGESIKYTFDLSGVVKVTNNDLMDAAITYYEGSIGFYTLTSIPTSRVANYCPDASTCTEVTKVIPGSAAVSACLSDDDVAVKRGSDVISYDITSSTNKACYPIVGTVDVSVRQVSTTKDCKVSTQTLTMTDIRTKFFVWLFNGDVVTGPLVKLGMGPSATAHRIQTYLGLCNIQCGDRAMGDSYCKPTCPSPAVIDSTTKEELEGGYTWNFGVCYPGCTAEDYILVEIEACGSTQNGEVAIARKFEYQLRDPHHKCENREFLKPKDFFGVCDFLPQASGEGISMIVISIILAAINIGVGVSFWVFRHKLIMKVSLPVSVIFYCLGSALFCLSSIAYLGANDETMCLIRPIVFHLPLTLMISSMIWRVYRLWRILDNKTLQKKKFSVASLIMQIFSLVCFDGVIHLIRVLTGLKAVSVSNTGFSFIETEEINNYYSFGHEKCTSDGDKWIMASGVVKVLLLICAMYLTLNVQKMMSNDKLGDAKPLMFASYNFSMFGVVYVFMSQSVVGGRGIVPAHLLISFSATISVLFVAIPKYMIIATIGDVTGNDVAVSLKKRDSDHQVSSAGNTTDGSEREKVSERLEITKNPARIVSSH